jgi:hypothetical protein
MNITLHPAQSEVFSDLFVEKKCRHSVVVASRGWGKSYFAGTCATQATFELLKLDKSVPNKNVYIIAPTYSQVTDIYYPMLAYQMDLARYANRDSRDAGVFWFPNDVVLKLVSYEAVERLRGTGAYFVVNDEVSSWTKGVGLKSAWQGIIQPCVSTRWSKKRAKVYGASSPGRSLTISTPKGYNFLYDMNNYQDVDDDWRSYHYDYHSSPYLDAAEIEKIRHTIDPLEFNREYLARFEDSGNTVFYCFDRKIHLDRDFEVDLGSATERGEDIHMAIDFNVGLQCSSAWVRRGNLMYCFDEFKGHPDTEQLAIAIKARYPHSKIFGYPDPSGRSRKTSAPVGRTDFALLESAGIICLARSKAPPISDSVNAVNRRLKTSAGDIHTYFSPKVQGVIMSMERTSWVENNPDTATIDKKEGVEHYSDGIRYMFEYLFPVQSGAKRVSRGFNF